MSFINYSTKATNCKIVYSGPGLSGKTASLKYISEAAARVLRRTLIDVDGKTSKTHPTEKPIELFSYLLKIFSNEGDLILDNASGSATTAVASRLSGRHFVCIEKDQEMYAKSLLRLERDAPEKGLF